MHGLTVIWEKKGSVDIWNWEQPELQEQISNLRKALGNPSFFDLLDSDNEKKYKACQRYTNLGNSLNTLGLFIQANECWEKAYLLDPRFIMAIGNRGYGINYFAYYLYNPEHQYVFMLMAHKFLKSSLEFLPRTVEERNGQLKFDQIIKKIESKFDTGFDFDKESRFAEYSLGDTSEEVEYRTWCLQHDLYINPLNDVLRESIAASDILTIPPIIASHDSDFPKNVIGFFNQIKQEFVSARWILFDAITSCEMHYSDSNVVLSDLNDAHAFCLAIEKTKLAFRSAYSLFDKISFMVNYYFDLNVKERNVSFRRIWYVLNANSEFKLKSEFQNNKNWPLRALFWLSKELYDKDFAFTLDPKAKELDDMRNALEHRALRIQDYKTTDPYLGESIVRDELQERTLRIFKLVRSAIIYLSLAINFEERRRSVEKGVNKSLIGEIELNSVRDDRKR